MGFSEIGTLIICLVLIAVNLIGIWQRSIDREARRVTIDTIMISLKQDNIDFYEATKRLQDLL